MVVLISWVDQSYKIGLPQAIKYAKANLVDIAYKTQLFKTYFMGSTKNIDTLF